MIELTCSDFGLSGAYVDMITRPEALRPASCVVVTVHDSYGRGNGLDLPWLSSGKTRGGFGRRTTNRSRGFQCLQNCTPARDVSGSKVHRRQVLVRVENVVKKHRGNREAARRANDAGMPPLADTGSSADMKLSPHRQEAQAQDLGHFVIEECSSAPVSESSSKHDRAIVKSSLAVWEHEPSEMESAMRAWARDTNLKRGWAGASLWLLSYSIFGCSLTVPDENSVFQNAPNGGASNADTGNGGNQADASGGSTGNSGNSEGKTWGGGAGGASTLVNSGGTSAAREGTGGASGIATAGATSDTSTGGTQGGMSGTVALGTGGIGGVMTETGGIGGATTETGGIGGATSGTGGTEASNTGAGSTGGTSSTGPEMVKLCGTATADSEQFSSTRGNHPATDGNDGNMSTRWTAADGSLGHYWTLDMGCEQSPAQVVIYWEYPASDYTDPYGIAFQVSHDGLTYTTLFTVEQSGVPVMLDLIALTAGAGGAGTGGAGNAGGASGATGGSNGGAGAQSGGASGGGAQSGGVSGAGGTSGAVPVIRTARYIRVVVNKLPPVVGGKTTWAGFFELQVYALDRNACGVSCP